MATFFARRIHGHYLTLAEVPEKYREATKAAYKKLYGVEISDD